MAKITSIPRQHATKLIDFQRLDGGLNLWEVEYRLAGNQSPEMKNLWWQDGVLQCRDGQTYLTKDELGTGYTCAPDLFWNNAFFHIGDKLYRLDMATASADVDGQQMVELVGGVPENRGTFFRYNEYLYYKNRGGFFKVSYDDADGSFAVVDVQEDAYTPVILLNADPATGAGDTYQPENRLCAKKTVKYNAAETIDMVTKTGDGSSKTYSLGKTAKDDHLTGIREIYLGNTLISNTLYSVDLDAGTVTFSAPPDSGATVTFVVEYGVVSYKLPVPLLDNESETVTDLGDGSKTVFTLETEHPIHSVDKVAVAGVAQDDTTYTVDLEAKTVTFSSAPADGAGIVFKLTVITHEGDPGFVVSVTVDDELLTEGTDYAVNLEEGTIVFVVPPPVHDPAVNNTVEVTYSKANPDALNSILDCQYVAVYGGAESKVCVVMGGSTKQPNAFFWNGNDDVGMNDSYWPMSFYQLAGDAKDRVTGFGVQYGTLMVLKERSVGKAEFSVQSVDDRDSILLTYTEVNSKIGCDLPWTIQLIENNVVFCNTISGVHLIRESTSAYENNIECVSRNVNGTPQRPGLLDDTKAVDPDSVCSFDDDNRYWVCANGHVYLWDYLISTWKDPSWFYFTNVNGIAYMRNVDKSYHLNSAGCLTLFERTFVDYEGAIEKVYQFPPQFFDTYDRLKDILYCIFTVRSDTDTVVDIQYQSDYETRYDLTPIRSFSWRMSPRNLAYRCLSVQKFAYVAKRKPGCRHVRHFSMRLTNSNAAQDLAIMSAQIYFRYLGRDR